MPTRAISKRSSLQPLPCGISVRAIPKGSSHKRNPVRDWRLMSLAQKDQLLEIGSRVRLGKPIICGRLSVSRDKSRTFRLMKFEQIFSLRCQNRTSGKPRSSPQTFIRMTFFTTLTRHTSRRRSCGSRDTTILRIAWKWWSRTGSNRRHPACKAGALPAELRPLISCSRIMVSRPKRRSLRDRAGAQLPHRG
jgi:hypothetical protein